MKPLQISMEKIIELRRQRKSWDDIALAAGVSRTLLRDRVRDFKDFPSPLMRGMRRPSGVTTEELEDMVKIEHLTDRDIADRLGLKSPGAAAKMRQRRGIHHGPKDSARNSIPKEELDWASSLLDEGNSYRGVEQITRVGYRALKRHFPGRGFTKEQSVAAAYMGRQLSQIPAMAA